LPVPYTIAFARDLPFGRCVAVRPPQAHESDAVRILAQGLDPAEQAHAGGLAEGRRVTWIGGRVALRAALGDLGITAGPIFSTPRGAPALPEGAVGSISHKETLAVAIAARAAGATLGIDVEVDRPPRQDISGRVLTDAERRRVDALGSPEARAHEVLVAFSAKEAIYKALDPWVRRTVSFGEVEIARSTGGALQGALKLSDGAGPFFVELHEEPAAGFILIAARVHPGHGSDIQNFQKPKVDRPESL
jgi:4'-phosphopantetheinyl transferase EntD